jgi:hypothetical protein
MTAPKPRKARPGPKLDPHIRDVAPVKLTLDPLTRRKALVLGGGNESAGVREAVRVAYSRWQAQAPSAEVAAAAAATGEAAAAG